MLKICFYCTIFYLQTLADTLCMKLDKDELKLKSKVLSLAYSQDGSEEWSLSCTSKHNKGLLFDAVIMTVRIFFLLEYIFVCYFTSMLKILVFLLC